MKNQKTLQPIISSVGCLSSEHSILYKYQIAFIVLFFFLL